MRRLFALGLLGAAWLAGQYTISAMAGYIHHVEGEVWLNDRAIAPKPEDFEHVMEGRRLRTGLGRAELMLVPGSFLRLGAESEIEMISAGLASAVVRLHRGALIVDLRTLFEDDSIAILIEDHEVRFRKTGSYRLDAGAAPALRVFAGRARVEGAGEGFNVKAGQRCDLASGAAQKAAKADADELEEWSGERGELLAVMSEKARKERWDGMSEAERAMLRMILYRPRPPASSQGPQPRMPPANGRSK